MNKPTRNPYGDAEMRRRRGISFLLTVLAFGLLLMTVGIILK